MRLSEAILLGSTILRPKARTTFSPNDGTPTHGCALGMFAVAHGCFTFEQWNKRFRDFQDYSWANTKLEKMPCGCKRGVDSHDQQWFSDMRIQCVIMHLFNEHVMGTRKRWTFEQLVDWVRSIEPADSPESVTNPQETSTEKALA